jgi:hypothetical protein
MLTRLIRLLIVILLPAAQMHAQTYVSLAPALTNTAGTAADKANLALEVGRQWDVFSLGLAFGKTTLSPVSHRDTSKYIELRPNLNIFQVGKFTNTFTPGIGYVFNAREDLVTEVTYGIEYSLSDQLHVNAYFGQFFYSGKETASNVSFFGISAAWFFAPVKGGSMIKQPTRPQK